MKKWLKWVIVVLILGLIVWLLKDINFYEVYLLLKYANPLWIGLAVLSTFLSFIVWGIRWKFIFKKDFWFLLNVLFAGAFFNTVTPGAGVGGEPFKAHFLTKRYNQPRTKMLGYVLGDKFTQIGILVILGVFSVLFVLFYVKISLTLRLILELALIIIVALFFFVSYSLLKKLHFNFGAILKKFHFLKIIKKDFKTPEHFEAYINKKVKSFLKIFNKFVRSRNNMIVGFFLSAVYWTLNFLTPYFLFLAFGFEIDFLSVAIVMTLGAIIAGLSILPGGVVITEFTMTLLFSAMGIFLPLALLVVLLTRLIYYFFSLVVGGLSLLYVRKITNGEK